MTELAVITGGGTGIGRALAIYFANKGMDILIIGRTESFLEEVKSYFPGKISYIVGDVSKPDLYDALNKTIAAKEVRFFVHCAAVLQPVGNLLEVSEQSFDHSLAVNLKAPLFLTQAIKNKMAQGGRVLFLSSKAATSAISGWGCYCVSKAALAMLRQSLKIDAKSFGFLVGSVSPGVVDTPMQEQVRSLSVSKFPDLKVFKDLHTSGKLMRPEVVAETIGRFLLESDDKTFEAKEWGLMELKK